MFFGDGRGSFLGWISFLEGPSGGSVTADVNGDGRPDVVSSETYGQGAVFLNTSW